MESVFDVSIVIVNYQMKEYIAKCLSSLFVDLQDDTLNVHVAVVDNASGDSLEDFLKTKFPDVTCIVLPKNLGFGRAQNVGLAAVEARYYFILNPDIEFMPGGKVVRRLFDFMESHLKIGVVGPKLMYPDGTLQYSCYRFPTFWQPLYSRTKLGEKGRGKVHNDRALMKSFNHNRAQAVDWLMGSAMFARGASLKAVGAFDDRFFMYYEDSDLCRRFWEKGYPVYYLPEVVLTHVHGRGSAKVPGILGAVVKNKLTRIHLISWLKYMWKWKDNYKYYSKV